MGFIQNSYPYNSLIMALASRPDYSEKALETWRNMRLLKVVPDPLTYSAVLRATENLGDVQAAYEAVEVPTLARRHR